MLSEKEMCERLKGVDLSIPRNVIDMGFGPLKCPTCDRNVPANFGETCPECGQKLAPFD